MEDASRIQSSIFKEEKQKHFAMSVVAMQTKCYLLLLDLDQETPDTSLVQDFFAAALDCIRQAIHQRQFC